MNTKYTLKEKQMLSPQERLIDSLRGLIPQSEIERLEKKIAKGVNKDE